LGIPGDPLEQDEAIRGGRRGVCVVGVASLLPACLTNALVVGIARGVAETSTIPATRTTRPITASSTLARGSILGLLVVSGVGGGASRNEDHQSQEVRVLHAGRFPQNRGTIITGGRAVLCLTSLRHLARRVHAACRQFPHAFVVTRMLPR
jgi:hypothetical protein